MNWFLLSLFSVFSLATAELLQQKIINKGNTSIDDRVSGFLTFGLISLLMLPFVLFSYKDKAFFILTPNILPIFLLTSLLSALGTIFYLKSFNVKSISYSTIFVSTSAAFSTLLGILIYQESVTINKFLGILLILFAIVIVNFTNESMEKQSLWGILAGFFYGALYICDKWFVMQIDPLLYLFWSLLFTSIILFLINFRHILTKLRKVKVKDLYLILFSGVGYLVYNMFTFLAYLYGGEVGVVDALNNSQIFLIILFELLFLGQKQHFLRKILSFFIAFIGVIILGNL